MPDLVVNCMVQIISFSVANLLKKSILVGPYLLSVFSKSKVSADCKLEGS